MWNTQMSQQDVTLKCEVVSALPTLYSLFYQKVFLFLICLKMALKERLPLYKNLPNQSAALACRIIDVQTCH